MSNWCCSILRFAGILFVFGISVPPTRAADFAVATRDDVLKLTSEIQATQFLTHATFGPTQAEIDALALQMRQLGTIPAASAWLDNQLAIPPSLHNPREYLMEELDHSFGSLYSRTGTNTATYQYTPGSNIDPPTLDCRNAFSRTRYRQHAWWHNVVTGQDQLRQRVAWALAQILSVGENIVSFNEEEYDQTVTNGPSSPTRRSQFMGLTSYYDIFVRNAFAPYRTVLGKATYHGVMGDWLFFRGNLRQASATSTLLSDQNYAREVMQLFTIGLNELFDDGTPLTNAQGVIPTFNADDVREYSQVFTGLGYGYGTYSPSNTSLNPNSPYTGSVSSFPNNSRKYQVPMRMAPAAHDRGPKYLLNGLVLPSTINTTGSPTDKDADAFNTTSHNEASANAEIDTALDGLVAHQSCAPFLVSRLIQRLVKSNPSRAYISRVVNVFKNNGSGQRGDMAAVVRAILLDPEAWQPIRVQYHRAPVNRFVVSTMGTEDCRLQEPVLTYTRYIRFFKAQASYQAGVGGSFASPVVLTNEFRINSVDGTFDQSPYTQPSVFNFYVSDYRPAGVISGYIPSSRLPNSAVFAPEFQIVNAVTSNATGNFFRSISSGTRIESNLIFTGVLETSTQYQNTANVCNVCTESTRTVVTFDFSTERTMISDATSPTTSGSPARVERLLEHLDKYLCGGTMGNEYKASLRDAITIEVATVGGVGNVSASESAEIVRGAVMSVMSSPSFLVTE